MQGRCSDDVDAEYFGETIVVEVERILGCEKAVLVGVKGTRVLHDVDVFWGPAGGYVSHHHLLQQWPVACEAYVETRAFGYMG